MTTENNQTVLDLKREPTDIDLVNLIYMHLNSHINADVANLFINDVSITTIKDSPSYVQRIILNKYFRDILLMYCGVTKKSVNNTLILLVNDGEVEDWMKLFLQYVFPFIHQNFVFETLFFPKEEEKK